MAEKILVTGGAGFIGSALIEKLLGEKDYEITVFDNFSTGYKENLENIKDKIKVIEGNILNYDELLNVLKETDFVFHMAAFSYVGESIKEPKKYNENNIQGTLNVLQAAKENSVKRVIFPSSCIVYGKTEKVPIKENESLKPNTPYGLTKEAGEFYCRFFFEVHGLETVCLRIFNAYGPRMQSRVLSIFANLILENKKPFISGNGKQARDFVFVEDIAEGLIKAMKAGKDSAGKSFNIGTGKGTNLNELIEKINSALNKNIKPEHGKTATGEIDSIIADTSLAEKELGFKAKVGLDKGLKQTLEWLKRKDLKQSQKSYIK